MVIFDTNYLLFLLQKNTPAPKAFDTGVEIPNCEERINHLVSGLQKHKEKIIIPTPVLAEVMVRADTAGPDYLSKINKSAAFRIEPFDTRAAIEVAQMTANALKSGDKRDGVDDIYAKIKYDRQIIGIALANSISTIYAHDGNLKKHAEKKGITVIGIHELEVPPAPPPTLFDWDKKNEIREDSDEDETNG